METPSDLNQKYNAKAGDSFKTKLNLFLYREAKKGAIGNLSQEDFQAFNLETEESLIHEYTARYWQCLESDKIGSFTIREIYEAIKNWKEKSKPLIAEWKKDYIVNRFSTLYPKEAFIELLKSEKCCYCGITTKEISELAEMEKIYKKSLRGWNLEVERKDSNREYSPSNCEMACYWCNNAKTDEFTYEEFKLVGKEIRKVWDKRKFS